jgi:hypothetical protein
MATSIHIFDNIDIFNKIYGTFIDDIEHKMPLLDLYVKGNKLWIVTNSNDMKEQPRLNTSLVHFRQGSIKDWEEGDEKLVTHGKMKFNYKSNQIEFFPRKLRKPLLSLRVGRYFGDDHDKKCDIDYDNRFYDFKNDRMIFILEKK